MKTKNEIELRKNGRILNEIRQGSMSMFMKSSFIDELHRIRLCIFDFFIYFGASSSLIVYLACAFTYIFAQYQTSNEKKSVDHSGI